MTLNTSSKQVRLNLYSNIFFLICNLVIGIYYTPYLVKHLGMSTYGILPLTLIINQYITIFTNAITNSLSRFLSISLQRGKYKEGSSYFNSSLIALFCFIILILPLIFYFIGHINGIFKIPDNLILPAKKLFSLTIISFIIALFSSIFNISQYSDNRLDLINITRVTRVGLKFIFTIITFQTIGVILFMWDGLILLLNLLY